MKSKSADLKNGTVEGLRIAAKLVEERAVKMFLDRETSAANDVLDLAGELKASANQLERAS